MALSFPNIDPVIVSFGPFNLFGQTFEPALRWYGFTYLVGFVAAMWLLNRQADRSKGVWSREQVSDLLFYGFLGVILGGRVGYVLFIISIISSPALCICLKSQKAACPSTAV